MSSTLCPSRMFRRLVTCHTLCPASSSGAEEVCEGQEGEYAKLTTKSNGTLILTTKGAAKKLYVKLTLSTPAKPGFEAYSCTKMWKTK